MPPLFRFTDVSLEAESEPGSTAGPPVTTRILDRVAVDLPDRTLVAGVGASGSGKSTLLRCCNRLEVPTSGTIEYRGVPLDEVDVLDHRRHVGMVFQRPTVFPGTVAENLRVAEPELSERAVVAALSAVGLDPEFASRQADDLSGGEAQRVCLARTLVRRPDVVLMDEVTSSLDPPQRRGIERLAQVLVEDGLGVVWVTHDMGQVQRIARYVVVMDRGRVVWTGDGDALAASDEPRVRALLDAVGEEDR